MPRATLLLLALLGSMSASASGWPLSPIELAPAEGSQYAPAIAAGGDGFLAVWIESRAFPYLEVRATRLDSSGQVLDAAGLLLFVTDNLYGSAVWQPEAVWTGEQWMVLFGAQDALMAAIVSADGAIVSTAREVARGNAAPLYQFDVLESNGHTFVAGQSPGGASILILDDEAAVVVPPRVVEVRSDARPISKVLAAQRGNEFLVVDTTDRACAGCTAFVAHRIAPDGTEIERVPINNGPVPAYRQYEMAAHGTGYIIVGESPDQGSVEAWSLSGTGTSITSRATIVATGTSVAIGAVNLVPNSDETDLIFFRSTPSTGVGLFRTTFGRIGYTPLSPFPLPEANRGELRFARNGSSVVSIATHDTATWAGSDVIIRSASTIESLLTASSRPAAFSARAQSEARATQNGSETLVTWIEGRVYGSGGKLLATRLDANGRPFGAPPRLLLDDRAYAIAGDGDSYLVAASFDSSLKLRRLRKDLTWNDAEWTTLSTNACNYLVDKSVTWDGAAYWIAWTSCSSRNPMLQRLDREMRPLTGPVEIATEETSSTIQLVPIGGAIIALWTGPDPGCQVCLCQTPVVSLSGARVSRDGVILNGAEYLSSDVTNYVIEVATNGSELLMLWSSYEGLSATRITSDFHAIDLTQDEYGRHGTSLDNFYVATIDVGWDGAAWLTTSLSYDYSGPPRADRNLRRFTIEGDLKSSWLGAATRQLLTNSQERGVVIVASPGHDSLLLEPLFSEATTGTARYYVRNITDPPRSRGARR